MERQPFRTTSSEWAIVSTSPTEVALLYSGSRKDVDNMEKKCNECGGELFEDSVSGELECNDCGLVMNDLPIEQDGGGMVCGEQAQSESDIRTRLKSQGMEGTTFDVRDVKCGKARQFWRRASRHQSRAKRERKVFADDVIEQIKSLELGKGVMMAAKMVVNATLIAQPDEKEMKDVLGSLPLNEIRIVEESERFDRERVAAISALMCAAEFGLISPLRLTPIIRRWGLKRVHCEEMMKRMKLRIQRMKRLGRVNIDVAMRPSLKRRIKINEALDKVRDGLNNNTSMSGEQVKGVIGKCMQILHNLGEPEMESSTPNERADMLVAIVAKQVVSGLNFTGVNTCIAESLDLSTGGICQRHKRLLPLLDPEEE
tara:strand:- start:187 stop:1299 length:1113 start_codon:yes stop_codon:yes gene_type:complete